MIGQDRRDPISIALVGVSGITQNIHIPNLLNLQFDANPPFRIAAVCDKDAALAAAGAAALGARSCADMEEVCADGKVDAVLIATPPNTHRRLLEQAIAGGKHVLMEKPLAFSIREAMEMELQARKAKTVARLGYMLRHHRDAALAKQRIDEGAIGRPQVCLNTVLCPKASVWPRRFPTPPRAGLKWGEPDPEDPDRLGFDMWSDNSVHYLNLMQWWLGPPSRVFAFQKHPDGSVINLEYENGAQAVHSMGPARSVERRDFTLIGEAGVIDLSLQYPHLRQNTGRFAWTSTERMERREALGDHSDMYLQELLDFAAAIWNGEAGDPHADFAMGVRDMLTVKAAHRSVKAGRPVTLREIADQISLLT